MTPQEKADFKAHQKIRVKQWVERNVISEIPPDLAKLDAEWEARKYLQGGSINESTESDNSESSERESSDGERVHQESINEETSGN